MSDTKEPDRELDRLDLDQPRADWSYAEWEAYRLRRENDELHAELERISGPREAHRHALRWAVVTGAVGAELTLAIALSGVISIILWVVFAANTLGLVAYGMTMDEWRSSHRAR